jgi:hypothetical protein
LLPLTNQARENKLGAMKNRLFLVALAGLILWQLSSLAWDQPLPPPRVLADSPADFSQFQLQGAGSCAAAACHNGNRAPGTAGSEYSTWILHDKHSRAYEVLFAKRSKEIQQNLLNLPSLETAQPQKNRLCLDCHVHPGPETARQRSGGFHKQDGVSCETCHGPAEKWLTRHARAEWKTLKSADKERLGMRDTQSIVGRARLCVDCHVGKPGSEVNHDLIAAGHPRLNFEFGAYHANMPHHWSDARDKDAKYGGHAGPDFEARAWAVGQAVTAQAALKLLAHRAEKESLPWPEFAEYDCFACHHNLQGKSWRQERNLKRAAGSLPWGTWYYSMPRLLARMHQEPLSALNELEREMSKAIPKRDVVTRKVQSSANEMHGLLNRIQRSQRSGTQEIAELFSRLANMESAADAGWEGASQQYLALAALHNAWKDSGKPSPSLAPTLKEMAEVLRFPKGFDSPGSAFTPKAFRDKLPVLQKSMNDARPSPLADGHSPLTIHHAPRAAADAKRQPKADTIYAGGANCAGCHSKKSPSKFPTEFVLMTEYDTWLGKDKHSQAFEVLTKPLAKKMGAILGLEPAKTDACLSCHAVNVPPERQGSHFRLEDGVSCEACHGPAKKWLGEHQEYSWRLKSGKDKEALGMIDLRNPVTQAKVCLSCHLGHAGEGKIVTHAMLAAGHPPLPGFEITAFHQFMPRHWRPAKDVPFLKNPVLDKPPPEFKDPQVLKKHVQNLYHFEAADFEETRLLVVSQAAVLQSAMDLLASQAKSTSGKQGILDLALFSCSSCHHELKKPYQLAAPATGNSRGRPRSAVWPGILIPLALRHAVGADQQAFADLSKEYADQLQVLHEAFAVRPFGEAGKVASAAGKLAEWAGRIQNLAAKNTWERHSANRLLDQLADLSQEGLLDYDSARQIAWAFKTIQHEVFPAEAKKHLAVWKALDQDLRLTVPVGRYLVENNLPEAFDRINNFDPEAFAKCFRNLQKK